MFSAERKGENMNNSAKIALVTGGSRGLGRATVEALAQRGVNVVLTYKTRLAEANEVVTRVEALGARAIALPFSAGEIDTFDAFVSAFQGALTELGADKFDYLVNNAGNASGMGFLNATEAEFDALYRIHVKSVFFLSQKLLPLLADGGQIELPVYSQDVHHETELVALIGRDARHVAEADALDYVAGYGIGLDLTARDTQSELKAKGMPWTKAKAFGADWPRCPPCGRS
jgi:hypothetical protein